MYLISRVFLGCSPLDCMQEFRAIPQRVSRSFGGRLLAVCGERVLPHILGSSDWQIGRSFCWPQVHHVHDRIGEQPTYSGVFGFARAYAQVTHSLLARGNCVLVERISSMQARNAPAMARDCSCLPQEA